MNTYAGNIVSFIKTTCDRFIFMLEEPFAELPYQTASRTVFNMEILNMHNDAYNSFSLLFVRDLIRNLREEFHYVSKINT